MEKKNAASARHLDTSPIPERKVGKTGKRCDLKDTLSVLFAPSGTNGHVCGEREGSNRKVEFCWKIHIEHTGQTFFLIMS